MQDGGFPNCRVNFAPQWLRDGRDRKEAVVRCGMKLKINSSSPTLKSMSWACEGCASKHAVWRSRCLHCHGPLQAPLSTLLSLCLLFCRVFRRSCFDFFFFLFFAQHILTLYMQGSSTGPVPSPWSSLLWSCCTTWLFAMQTHQSQSGNQRKRKIGKQICCDAFFYVRAMKWMF